MLAYQFETESVAHGRVFLIQAPSHLPILPPPSAGPLLARGETAQALADAGLLLNPAASQRTTSLF
jgi:hypothetical protein